MSIVNASEFKVGQKWAYKTRHVETGSTLTIVKIDESEGANIFHISLEGVKIKNPHAPNGYGDKVSHLPISEDALKNSVTKLLEIVTTPLNYEEGYQIWKEAFDQGNAGFFTGSVSESVEYMEKAINQ